MFGAIAQLGERYNGIVEVDGSIPSGSTKSEPPRETEGVFGFEMRYGIAKSSRARENAAALAAFLALDLEAWPFEADDADAAGEIAPPWSAPAHRSAPTTS